MIRPALVPWPAVAWVDLLNRVIDAAADLACRGYGPDPDEDGLPLELAAELASLTADCKLCRIGPSALAEHWMSWKQAQYQDNYERGLPAWTCGCGHVYKLQASEREDQFHQVRDGGLLGSLAGRVRRDSKGKVKQSDSCPACGVPFAETAARQQVPEGALF